MILKALVLGIIQGLTEFLPISSSGHLALLENIWGIEEPIVLATFLHFGTLAATIFFFRKAILEIIKDLLRGKRETFIYLAMIIIASIPTVIFVLLFESVIEKSFNDIKLIAITLGITGLILILTRFIKRTERKVNFFSALAIGIGQMLAVLSGLSRSGLTISAGLFTKVSPQEAFQFSFLLSIPAVLGACLFELKNITVIDYPIPILIGVGCSFIVGLIGLRILQVLVQRYFHLFGLYCLIISLLILLLI